MQVDKLEVSEVEKKRIDEKTSCYNRCYDRYKDDDSESEGEEEERPVTFIGSKFLSFFPEQKWDQLGASATMGEPPSMLDSPDISDEQEEEHDPVTVEDPTDEETVLLEVLPGLVNWERLQMMLELEERGELEEEEDFDFEEEDDELVIAAVFEVNGIGSGKEYVKIAIDSAAAESVCPPNWAGEVKVTPC